MSTKNPAKVVEKLHPHYVTDEKGRRTAVMLSIREYDSLLEDLQDLATIAERVNEESVNHEDVIVELKNSGYLSD
ncbi:MAG: hypothetical protein EA428_09425 [Spirochaetaceae bacterium]|nr:MAG: hypothetical protein EA428_09425 [Spirochaetaceae bacterium]